MRNRECNASGRVKQVSEIIDELGAFQAEYAGSIPATRSIFPPFPNKLIRWRTTGKLASPFERSFLLDRLIVRSVLISGCPVVVIILASRNGSGCLLLEETALDDDSCSRFTDSLAYRKLPPPRPWPRNRSRAALPGGLRFRKARPALASIRASEYVARTRNNFRTGSRRWPRANSSVTSRM